jgi:hypothetical protein
MTGFDKNVLIYSCDQADKYLPLPHRLSDSRNIAVNARKARRNLHPHPRAAGRE